MTYVFYKIGDEFTTRYKDVEKWNSEHLDNKAVKIFYEQHNAENLEILPLSKLISYYNEGLCYTK